MNNLNKLSIIIPCYNEEKNFILCSNEILKFTKNFKFDYEIIFVDDGSTDNTYNELLEFSKKNKNYKLLKLSKNYGSHISITAGINFRQFRCYNVCPLDNAYLLEHVDTMVEKFKNGSEIVWSVEKNLDFINNCLCHFIKCLFYSLVSKLSI